MPQDRDNLRYIESACLHSKSSQPSCQENSTAAAHQIRNGLPEESSAGPKKGLPIAFNKKQLATANLGIPDMAYQNKEK
jgi:hypothetical protein